MEPNYLRQLAEIIELGSMSMAAKSLNVSQPTLSRNVKSLEAMVGAPVLKRGRYGVTPTLVGELLSRDGRAIRDALINADQELGHWKGGLEGRLRVGVGTMLAHSLIPQFLADSETAAWNVTLRIEVEGPNQLIQRVRSRELDVALVEVSPYLEKDELTQVSLFEDRRAFFSGERHPLARRKRVSARDIVNTQQVLLGSFEEYRRIPKENFAEDDKPNRVIELTGDVSVALHLLSTGNFVAILPEFVMSHLCDDRKFVRLNYDGEMPTRTLSVWHRSDMAGHPLIKSFSQLLVAFISRL